MPVLIKLDYDADDDDGVYTRKVGPIHYRQMHRMRRLLIDGASVHFINTRDKLKREVKAFTEEKRKLEEEGRPTEGISRGIESRKGLYIHYQNAIKEIMTEWILNPDIKALAKMVEPDADKIDIAQAQERVKQSPCDIDYENIPGITCADVQRDPRAWIRYLEMAGLLWFVSMIDSGAIMSLGQALDVERCIHLLEKSMLEIVDSKQESKQKAQETFDILLEFKSLCKSACELYVKNRQYSNILFVNLVEEVNI